MKMTLKKFAKDPKHIIRKAPIVIIVNNEPSYAIIPYSIYKMKYEEATLQGQEMTEQLIREATTGITTSTPKKHGRIWRLLFA